MKGKKILMLSTTGKGGILSVIEGYQRDGVFDRWNVQLIATHTDGSFLKKLFCAGRATVQVAFLAARNQVGLVHCHVSMYGSFWRKSIIATISRLYGIHVLLHMHGSDLKEFYEGLPPLAKRMVVRQLHAATAVLVLSESWRDFIHAVAPGARVVVIPNYVDLPPPRSASAAGSHITLLFLGIVGTRKGVYDLLQAFAAAVRRVPGLHLQIAGNGEVDEARARAETLGIAAQVDFLGWVAGASRDALLESADIFVLPSYNEGLPLSVLEAMSWGIPVITTPVGGIPEVIADRHNGFLVAPGAVEQLCETLVALAEQPALGRRVGEAARRSIEERFSKKSVLPILESLYSECA